MARCGHIRRATALALMVAAAGCAGPSGSVSPGNVSPNEATPTVAPAVTPGQVTTIAEPLRPGQFALTTTDDGAVRGEPSDLVPVIDRIAEGLEVYVLEGPLMADGRRWYRVQYPTTAGPYRFGWVRDPSDTTLLHPFTEAACPIVPDGTPWSGGVPHLSGGHPEWVRSCMTGRELTLGPVIAGRNPSPLASDRGEPAWLATEPSIVVYGVGGPAGDSGFLGVHADPALAGGIPLEQWLDVTGHFDDPRAGSCRRTVDASAPLESAEESALWCRQQFVVTAVRDTAPPAP